MAQVPQSYDPRFFERLFAIEDKHFWFRARNRVISVILQSLVRHFRPGYHVLEVGSGTGNTLRQLEQTCTNGTVLGMDLFFEGLRYAQHRVACPLVQGDMHFPPFGIQFDLIGLFDVLEHLPDDMAVLRDLHRMLKPNGCLMLTVPAHMSLWSYFDEASHHCRRYEYNGLENKLNQAGYRVEYLTHYMASIFPLVWIGRRVAGHFFIKQGNDIEQAHQLAGRDIKIIPVLNDALFFMLLLETRLLKRRRRLPIGTSLLAVARKE